MFFIKYHEIDLGPRNVLCVVEVTTSQYSNGHYILLQQQVHLYVPYRTINKYELFIHNR